MIKSVLIKNFILIDELFLEFENGFNVLTGETGAGKSIILKAIDTVMGARVHKDVIFNKEKPALVEITFLHSKKDLQNLKDFDLTEETVISREITPNSQKIRLNGALVNLETIKELREYLLDIHSQNQSYTYVLPKYHIELLDAYCKNSDSDFSKNLLVYEQSYKEFSDVSKKLAMLKENNSKNLQEIDFLKFQINELDSAAVYEGEEEELNRELDVLSNIQSLKEMTYGLYYSLGADDGVCDALSKMKALLSSAVGYDKKLEEVESAFIEAHENLKFCSDFLREYSQNLEDNPQRLNEVNERLSLILKLKRKYNQYKFYGLGPDENYIDRDNGVKLGIYEGDADTNLAPYLVPQETGNHRGTRWLEVTDVYGEGLRFVANGDTFESSVLPYSEYEIEQAMHQEELSNPHYTWVRLLAAQMGVGGDDSWGAPVQKQFWIPSNKDLTVSFTIEPTI